MAKKAASRAAEPKAAPAPAEKSNSGQAKAATKAKQGINPFTKDPMTIKAKPARNVIKAVPLKALKDLV